MKTVVEITIPRCDTAIMDWLTYRTDVPFEKVIEACIVRGLFELSKDPQTLTDQTIQEWCDHTWTVVGELLSEVP